MSEHAGFTKGRTCFMARLGLMQKRHEKPLLKQPPCPSLDAHKLSHGSVLPVTLMFQFKKKIGISPPVPNKAKN